MEVNNIRQILKINNIIENEYVLGIALIGSALNQKVYTGLHDIDLFVILTEQKDFQREVVIKDRIKYDISYISIELLQKGIEEKWEFLFNSLKDYKLIYIKDNYVETLLEEIKKAFENGPNPISKEEINFLRFELFQDYEDIINRIDDKINVEFLTNNLFRKSLVTYFQLNNLWIPKEKKLLQRIKERDKYLYNLCQRLIKERDTKIKLNKLWNILCYILKPYNGVLKEWPKGKFPLK